MQVRFWGTRGSLAKPGPATIRYGGNTSCVELRTDAGELLILDCGTGAHELGHLLQRESPDPIKGNLLISHTHWDHIQGIPFFAPFFAPRNEWDIYAPQGFGETLRATLAGQMEYTYFPITAEAFAATLRYHNVSEGAFMLGDARIVTRYLNHPALTVGYRIEADGAAIVYACDHEPHARDAAMAVGDLSGQDALHSDFLRDADLVIHDAQYLASEYLEKEGWGHSTVEYAVRACERAGVRRLALTHHDPLRDDAAVDRLLAEALRFRSAGGALEIVAASEGLTIEARGVAKPGLAAPAGPQSAQPTSLTVMVLSENPSLIERVAEATKEEGLAVAATTSLAPALTDDEQGRPPLLVVDGAMPADAVTACIQNAGDIPVILIGGDAVPTTAANVEPIKENFSQEYLRSRIRTWLMRGKFAALPAAITEAEAKRLSALRSLRLLDTPPEERFDRLTRLAAGLFNVPVTLITLVDENRQWFKSKVGMEASQTPRHISFCTHALQQAEPLIINDALQDTRFAGNPLVTGHPRIRFYAGMPMSVAGEAVGTLCLIDTKPRVLSREEVQMLKDLGSMVQMELGRAGAADVVHLESNITPGVAPSRLEM